MKSQKTFYHGIESNTRILIEEKRINLLVKSMVDFNHDKVRYRLRTFFFLLNLWIALDLPFSKGERIYVTGNKDNRKLQNPASFGYHEVEWNIDLGGKESLLESPSLEAGFEQMIKDYMNDDVQCNNETNLGNASFFGFSLGLEDDGKVTGRAMCQGHSERCKWKMNQNKSDANRGNMTTKNNESDEFCETFRNSTIFDYFKKTIATRASFNYDADVNVNSSNLEGALDLSYNVTFKPAKENGLDMIETISFHPTEIVESSFDKCTDPQCTSQRSILFHIFRQFGLRVDREKHTCLYRGINCNEEGLVTQIWLGKYRIHDNILFFKARQYSFIKSLTIP